MNRQSVLLENQLQYHRKVVLLPSQKMVRESLSNFQARIPLTNSPWMSVNR
jgi:hypothetical protein